MADYYIKIQKRQDFHQAKLIRLSKADSMGFRNHVIEDEIHTEKGYLDLQAEISGKGWIEKL